MCVSCGCGQANDDHGDVRNLTMDRINQAGEAVGISAEQVAENIQDAIMQGASSRMTGEGGPAAAQVGAGAPGGANLGQSGVSGSYGAGASGTQGGGYSGTGNEAGGYSGNQGGGMGGSEEGRRNQGV